MKKACFAQRSDVILTGRAYVLRQFTPEDISPQYISWLNDPQVNRFLEVRFVPQTHETALAYVSSYYGEMEKYMWGIFPKDAVEPVGTATLYDINRNHGTSELGILIGEMTYWGKGASNEAMELVLDFAFDSLGLRRVTGGSYALNHGMNFTFKNLGFALEGKQRQAGYLSSGSYADTYRWGILDQEWRARRERVSHIGDSNEPQ